jgi:hypothetical protein
VCLVWPSFPETQSPPPAKNSHVSSGSDVPREGLDPGPGQEGTQGLGVGSVVDHLLTLLQAQPKTRGPPGREMLRKAAWGLGSPEPVAETWVFPSWRGPGAGG